jgi:inorganic triphosphatase YgiF
MAFKNIAEREFKFVLKDPAVFEILSKKQSIAGFTLGQKVIQSIHDTYFDSEDLDLYLQKAGLRVRKEKNQFCVTFKKHINLKKGLLTRNEIEENLSSAHFENALIELKSTHPYELALALSNQKSIKPIVDLVNQRIKIELVNNPHVFELCLDTIQYSSANPQLLDYEIELEFLQGDIAWMNSIISSLTTEFHMQRSKSSKYKRCLEANSKIKR